MTPSSPLDAIAAREFPRLQRDDATYLNCAATAAPERAVRVIAEHNELRAEPWRYSAELQFATLARSRELAARSSTPRLTRSRSPSTHRTASTWRPARSHQRR
jgi:hypothetical protein